MKKNSLQGFTLIEVLLVIAILAILAAVVIVAINPGKQFGEAQDAQRRNDVRAIIDAVQQYSIDHGGAYPETIPWGGECFFNGLHICRYQQSCDGVNLDVVADGQEYLADLPIDPTVDADEVTGYKIVGTDDGRLSVCAPNTYGSEPIVVIQ